MQYSNTTDIKRLSLRTFLEEIKKGNSDFLHLLNISGDSFVDASFEELLSNTDDVLSGVNRVQKNFSNTYFEIFDSCLIKHYDNRQVKFVFYTTTSDYNQVFKIATTLFSELGLGIYDSNRFTPFTNTNKIVLLADGKVTTNDNDIVHFWSLNQFSLLLQYKTAPLRQFSLMLTINPAKGKDKTIRRKGTILNILSTDINEALFLLEETDLRYNQTETGSIYIDYDFCLPKKELGVFDKITIRIFDEKRVFRTNVQTHVTFIASKISVSEIAMVTEKLIAIYGPDDYSSEEMELHERETIEEGRFWLGRKWDLNEAHGLWDISDKGQKLLYSVSIDFEPNEGFKLFILAYHRLASMSSNF